MVALIILVIEILWIFWWSAIVVSYMSRHDASGFRIFFVIISFYWNLEVLKNISHVTTAGVAATWYYSKYKPEEPTKNSFKRAATTSFGSICLGSLVVAIVSALKHIVRHIRNQSQKLSTYIIYRLYIQM